jgi:hypothetical protein
LATQVLRHIARSAVDERLRKFCGLAKSEN